MGLGALLLNAERNATRLRGDKPAAAGAADPVRAAGPARGGAGPVIGEEPDNERAQADYVILWPALGCPELVGGTRRGDSVRRLEIIFLSRLPVAQVDVPHARALAQSVTVVDWDQARAPYIRDGVVSPGVHWQPQGPTLGDCLRPDGVQIKTKQDLAQYRTEIAERPWQFGELLHTMPDIVPKVYLAQGFKTIVSASLALADGSALQPGRVYALYYGPENGLLRDVLRDDPVLEKPYDDIPLMYFEGKNMVGGPNQVYRGRGRVQPPAREHLVRLFHPFTVVADAKRDYLDIGHVTDLHVSTLWDFFDYKIYPNYAQDTERLTEGRDPRQNADSRFARIATRYNNPNLNLRCLTRNLNARADIILQTGDLIDFNRGFDHNPDHDPDRDYVFNLNWIRFYELLLLDYQRPTYTLLGNHDRRLNPYPPRVRPEAVHLFLLLYLVVVCAGMGAACGATLGPIEGSDAASNPGILFLEGFGIPLLGPVVLFAFLLLLGGIGLDLDTTWDFLFTGTGLGLCIGGGYLISWLIVWFTLLISRASPGTIKDAASGAQWGTIVGASLGSLMALIVGIVAAVSGKVDYMTHIVNLVVDESQGVNDFRDLLDDKHVGYLNAFGRDGLLYMTERAYDWYALVINPFQDYAFRHGNMLLMMGDWGGSEILPADPPVSDDSLTDRQWKMLKDWLQWAVDRRNELQETEARDGRKEVVPILGLHTPVFCPMINVNLDTLNSTPTKVTDGDLARGTMDEHRQDLIGDFYRLWQGTYPGTLQRIPAISLTGHTHTYDVFHLTEADKVTWHQARELGSAVGVRNGGLHITTTCGGPPSDSKGPEGNDAEKVAALQTVKPRLASYERDKDSSANASIAPVYQPGDRILRPAGCRLLTFDARTGALLTLDEIPAETSRYGDS